MMTSSEKEICDKLAPFVQVVKDYTDMGDNMGILGSYYGQPVFKINRGNIHILCWHKHQTAFHKDTKSVKVAIKEIIESVKWLKDWYRKRKIEEINEDFK